jgi:hypothetical protein
VKVREPVARPLDVVAAELLLSASQAFLVGVLLYLAVGAWDDRGVDAGSVAVIVAALGLAVGGGWAYWLLGGVGWPLAAANVPTALFIGCVLVLGWSGEQLFRVEGVPLLLSLAASVYGLVCGVFLDSPRRWRWDQRQKPRPGAVVPRVSPTTQRLAAQVPRSIPRRATVQPAEFMPRPAPAEGATAAPAPPAIASGSAAASEPVAVATSADDAASPVVPATISPDERPEGDEALTDAAVEPTLGSMMPTERLERMADAASQDQAEPATQPAEPSPIELPTSLEPKAQKSPWAWAAPPSWTRDEDDEPPRRRTSKRS